MNEGVAKSDYAFSTVEAFAECNVKGAFLGHDHANDWVFTVPEGIVYGYGVKTGSELYSAHISADREYIGADMEVSEDFDLIGASLVTLENTQGDFKLEHLYLNERDEGDFVEWVEY